MSSSVSQPELDKPVPPGTSPASLSIPMAQPATGSESHVLTSWKEVAVYLGKGVRTVQRWERELALPVRRPYGLEKHVIVALPSELDDWMHTRMQPRTANSGPKKPVLDAVREKSLQRNEKVERLQRLIKIMYERAEELQRRTKQLMSRTSELRTAGAGLRRQVIQEGKELTTRDGHRAKRVSS